MITLYGISNCDTVKKAQKWLTTHEINFQFHDFRKQGLSVDQLNEFINALGWENILNKRSTTFRNLPENIKNNLNQETATNAMLAEPTLIKRPVVFNQQNYFVGFNEPAFTELFK